MTDTPKQDNESEDETATAEPRRWKRAEDIPAGVVVTIPECTSDSRMRWRRDAFGQWTRYYPGSLPCRTTAQELDARAVGFGFEEKEAAPWVPAEDGGSVAL